MRRYTKSFLCSPLLLLCFSGLHAVKPIQKFPPGFLFGTSTSAYQVEGAWNEDGKSENIWDRLAHAQPELVADGSSGDIACDSYHKLEEDVAMLKHLGVDYYRFSLSWSRILPSPLTNNVNKAGVQYYNRLVDLLLANNIRPFVTLYHWDLPQYLQDLGGFTNSLIIDVFSEYAKVVFTTFGDRVKLWATFNQPRTLCGYGYGDTKLAPALNHSGTADYLCGHNLLKAHAKVYHLYNDIFKPTQKGRVSLNLNSDWYQPASNSTEDISAAERAMEFTLGWFAHPIFTKQGNYPPIMLETIARRSRMEQFPRSRLPLFTNREIAYIRGTHDFFALNHYRTFLAAHKRPELINTPSFDKDMNVALNFDPSWPSTGSIYNKVVPWGLSKLLNWIKKEYENPDIYITENGYADTGELEDTKRIQYHSEYLSAVLDSIYRDRVRVKSYTVWGLVDNYEWTQGYTQRFGLYHVDFSSPNRTRTPKASAGYYRQVIRTRTP